MVRNRLYCIVISVMLCFIGVTRGADMSVQGSDYIKFDLYGTKTNFFGTSESLSLRFKTVDPNGLLFYAHGTAGFYMSLELYHCKLRYTINLSEQFQSLFGDQLCDNQWHSVRVARDKHKLNFDLDKQPTKVVVIKMSRKFLTQYVLPLDFMMYVGGTWKTENTIGKAIVKNFHGCLGDVLFNALHLISDAQRNKTGYTIVGTVSYTCPATEYKPISFLSDMAYLKVPCSDPNKVSVEFRFRTYDKNGILMYRDGSKITVYLYLENGKLKFEFYIPGNEIITLNTDTYIRDTDFNDGKWHSVKASLDSTAMIFRVDNGSEIVADAHAVMLSYSNSLDFENFTHVGGGHYYKRMHGFVGCMQDLYVNGVKINLVKLPKEITAVSVAVGKCTARALCHPSPCKFESRCEQHSNNITCKCKKFYRGRYCKEPLFQSTCQGYKELGMNEDAYCRLDPDGKGPLQVFGVLCNMTDGKDAVTIVNHTHSDKLITIPEGIETFSYAAQSWAYLIHYQVDLKSLKAVVEASDHCRQYVEFNCINTTFLSPRANDMPGAYWVSYNGVENHYWGGGKLGGATCACGTTLSCHDKKKTCNCDTGDGVWRQDAGYLTNKNDLPVGALYLPKSAKNSKFTVGPLECFGRRKTLTRDTDEQKFVGIACEPLVTKPPPVFPTQQKKLTTTMKPKLSTQKTTRLSTSESSTTVKTKSTEVVLSTSNGTKSLSTVNASAASTQGNKYTKDRYLPTSLPTTIKKNSSFFPVNPTDHIVANVRKNAKEHNVSGWWFILTLTASSFLVIIAFVLLLVMLRHKRKNGVWCKGLFMFTKHQQLPKIEIYRHSIGTDSPDILHMEDFKNTKVVDVHFHRGHFVAKKPKAKKKTVTFNDRC